MRTDRSACYTSVKNQSEYENAMKQTVLILLLAASSVAASLTQRLSFDESVWAQVVAALEKRELNQEMLQKLDSLAWKLDEERTATLGRMRHGHA